MNIEIGGIPWYKENEFAEIKSIMEDGDKLHEHFADWLAAAQRVKKIQQDRGIISIEAYINPTAFVAWCKARGLSTNANARLLYANLTAKETYQRGGTA